MLCSVDVAVIIFGHNKRLYEYASGDLNETINRFHYVGLEWFTFTTKLIICSTRRMVGLTNIKAQQISMADGIWVMMMTMIWDRLLPKIR